MPIQNLIVGIVAGAFVTTIVTVLWPKKRARLARPLVSALLGAGVAYLVIKFM